MTKQTSTHLSTYIQDHYEVVANDHVTDCNEVDLVISGALLVNNTFKKVLFENCTFFSSKIDHCQFINCQFKNCKFQFSSITECNFQSSRFENCQWETPYLMKNKFHLCSLDHPTTFFMGKNDNQMVQCFSDRTDVREMASFEAVC